MPYKNPEDRKAQHARSWLKHRDRANASARRFRVSHPELTMLRQAQARAKRRSLSFNIDVSDVVIPKRCPILDVELQRGTGKTEGASPSLDRKDPRAGYTKGNVWVISWRANAIKRDATSDELFRVANAMQECGAERYMGGLYK